MAGLTDIGGLGLDTGNIEAALDRVGKKLGQTAAQTEGLNMAITAAGAAIAIWASNILDARDRADQLDKAIKSVAKSLGAAEFNTESGLETRLKEVDGLLEKLESRTPLHQVIIEKVGDFFTGKDRGKEEDAASTMAVEKRKEIETQLAIKITEQTKLMQMRRNAMKEEAEIAEVQIKYDEMRSKLQGSMTNTRQEALKAQKEEAIISIRQKYAEERQAEQQKAQQQADEDAKKQRDQDVAEIMRANDAMAKENAAEEKSLKERLALNKKITEEIQAQTREMKAARGGNATAAKRESMENEYQRKIKEAIARGNKDEEAALVEQRNIEREDLDVEESKKTPGQKRDERKSKRQIESDEAKARARNRELERRGERGAKSAAIEDRTDIVNDRKDRAGSVEKARREGAGTAPKGFDEKAAKDLSDIAAAFRNKGS